MALLPPGIPHTIEPSEEADVLVDAVEGGVQEGVVE